MLVAAAAQFDSFSGVRRRPDHTIHSQRTRSGNGAFTAGRLQAWVNRPNSSAKGCSPRRWRLAHADARHGQRFVHQTQIQLLHRCHSGRSRNSASPITSPRHARQAALRPADGPTAGHSACTIRWVYPALSCSRRSEDTRGRVWRKAFEQTGSSSKGERVVTSLDLDQTACGLNDWHCPEGALFGLSRRPAALTSHLCGSGRQACVVLDRAQHLLVRWGLPR